MTFPWASMWPRLISRGNTGPAMAGVPASLASMWHGPGSPRRHVDYARDARCLPAAARTGRVHSVEVWQAGRLAGGVYGVAPGGMFAGESMFYRVRDASRWRSSICTRICASAGISCSTFSS